MDDMRMGYHHLLLVFGKKTSWNCPLPNRHQDFSKKAWNPQLNLYLSRLHAGWGGRS